MKLTNAIRDKIVQAVFDVTYKPVIEGLTADIESKWLEISKKVADHNRNELGDICYKAFCKYRNLARESSRVAFYNGTEHIYERELAREVHVFSTQYTYAVDVAGFEDLIAEHRALIDKRAQNLEEWRNHLREEAYKILRSVNTDKQLLEVWPEVVKYYDFEGHKNNLPAVINADKVNTMIKQITTIGGDKN